MSDSGPHFEEMARRARAEVAAGSATIVDVRTDEEWQECHIPGALHWDIARLEAGEFPDIDKTRRVYVYCAAGGRAASAADFLRSNGWTDVTNMGGLRDWESIGGPVER